MIEIAMVDQQTGIYQKDISKNQDISNKYLDHIIMALRTAGLISKRAGKRSGYRLSRDAEDITMLDIYLAFEHEFSVTDCLAGNFDCERSNSCAARIFWDDLNRVMKDYFSSVTLASMRDKSMNGQHGNSTATPPSPG